MQENINVTSYPLDCAANGRLTLYVRPNWVRPILDEKCNRILKLCEQCKMGSITIRYVCVDSDVIQVERSNGQGYDPI